VEAGTSPRKEIAVIGGDDSSSQQRRESARDLARVVEEFRANGGQVGGAFEGVPLTLVHHRGRRSGRDHISPVMYLADDTDPGTIYVFASKAGAPTHPDWYHNLAAAGVAEVEVGTETYQVSVIELRGDERDRIYAAQANRYPGFAEYARKTAGTRTIPVLALRRRSEPVCPDPPRPAPHPPGCGAGRGVVA
jgi:deazaflavin-dependent oxidoreductase (nitroreductase family)